MMTMVVSDQNDKYFVFSKGAETAILPLITDKESEVFKQTSADIEKFAESGMRTLVFAYKQLEGVSLDIIKSEENMFFESDLTLLGATGVEDML